MTAQRVLPALLHGEAVNIDMSLMVYVAHQRGLLTAEEKGRIIQCMLGLELPVWHQDCSLDLVQKSLSERLKHSAGSLRMPLPIGLGQAGIIPSCLYLASGCFKIQQSFTFFSLVNTGKSQFLCY